MNATFLHDDNFNHRKQKHIVSRGAKNNQISLENNLDIIIFERHDLSFPLREKSLKKFSTQFICQII